MIEKLLDLLEKLLLVFSTGKAIDLATENKRLQTEKEVKEKYEAIDNVDINADAVYNEWLSSDTSSRS